MNNVFRTDLGLHRTYDLKGSTYGRTAGPRPSASGGCACYTQIGAARSAAWRDTVLGAVHGRHGTSRLPLQLPHPPTHHRLPHSSPAATLKDLDLDVAFHTDAKTRARWVAGGGW